MSATRVKISYGYTMNLGDFNSLRIDLGVEDDVRQGEKIADAWKRVDDFVTNKLEEEIEAAKALRVKS